MFEARGVANLGKWLEMYTNYYFLDVPNPEKPMTTAMSESASGSRSASSARRLRSFLFSFLYTFCFSSWQQKNIIKQWQYLFNQHRQENYDHNIWIRLPLIYFSPILLLHEFFSNSTLKISTTKLHIIQSSSPINYLFCLSLTSRQTCLTIDTNKNKVMNP